MNILLIGTFPPPTHGMATINQALIERMKAENWHVEKINTTAPNMQNPYLSRLSRLRVILPFWLSLIALKDPSNYIAYLALSAGWGQVYDLATVIFCKIRGVKCAFHHHSVAYLIKKQITTSLLIKISGGSTLHVVLCEKMKENLERIYGCQNVLILSNIALTSSDNQSKERMGLKTIGFLSNITQEKGGWDFMKLAQSIQEEGWQIKCKVAGPCHDLVLSKALQKAHEQGAIEWVGPVYNKEKISFWNSVDLFVFPTQYENEAEPLVVWEALASGVPVIAYNRGCIAIQIGQSGEVIPADSDFVDSAMKILKIWINNPNIYKGYMKEVLERWEDVKKNAEKQWGEFIRALKYEMTKEQKLVSHRKCQRENVMLWSRLMKLSQIIVDPFLVSALIKGAAAGTEHKTVLQGLNFDFIVDVGANRSQFALITRKVFPLAKIHSFEPLEEPARIFKRIFGGDPNVTLHICAIGREKTTATIYITRDDDSSSLLPITKTQSSMFPGATEKETRQVTVLPLSQALGTTSIPPASLLKIDVQGFELDVLQGCEDVLQKFSHLYIECSFIELYEGQALAHQIIAWLEQRNFIFSGVHNLYYEKNGRAIQGDFLFTHRK